MESMRTEEQSRPLAAPERRVASAYTTNDRQNKLKKYSFWVFAFVAFLLVSTGSRSDDKKQKRAKKLRNKAETMPEEAVQKFQQANKKIDLNEKYAQLNSAHAMLDDSEDSSLINDMMEDEDDLQAEIARINNGVAVAEMDEIETNYSILTSAVQTMEENVKYYLGSVFGYGDNEEDDDDDDTVMSETSADIQITEEQLDMIAKKISERLESDVKREFREKADVAAQAKIDEIEQVVGEDKDAQMKISEIEHDVKEAGDMVVEDLKEEIEDAANRVKEEMPERVKRIRNDVVKEVTGKRLDEIEEKKRLTREGRKAKREELVKKFQELQEKGKERAATNNQVRGTLKGVQGLKGVTYKGRRFPTQKTGAPEDRIFPMKKSLPQGSEESGPSGGDASVHSKSGSADDGSAEQTVAGPIPLGISAKMSLPEGQEESGPSADDASGHSKSVSADEEDSVQEKNNERRKRPQDKPMEKPKRSFQKKQSSEDEDDADDEDDEVAEEE